jgi:DNA repair exonuclease SbcCD nuclease subunit
MKILAIGDQHFKIDNICEIEIFINKIKEIVYKTKPDIIVLLGDLLHTHEKIHTSPLNKALEFIDSLRKEAYVFVLVGNHDYINAVQFLSENHWLNSLKEWNNVTIVDKVISNIHHQNKIILLPYVHPGRFEEALNTIEGEWRDSCVIFCHQEFYGCSMGGYLSVEGDKWDLSNPQVISGHIHQRQKLQGNIYYTGSSMEVSFGETENNTISLIELQENRIVKIEDIELNLSKKKIIYTTVDEVIKIDFDKFRESSDDKIKVSVSGGLEDFKCFKKTKQYQELIANDIKVVFKPKRIETKLKNETLDKILNDNCNEGGNFKKILLSIVESKKNPFLVEMYELIINNRIVEATDVMYL